MSKRRDNLERRGYRDNDFYESMPMQSRAYPAERRDRTRDKSSKWMYGLLAAALIALALALLAAFDLDLRGGGVNVEAPAIQTPEVPGGATPAE